MDYKRKRTEEDFEELVVVGITNTISTGFLGPSNETVVATLDDACSYTFKSGATIDRASFFESNGHVIYTKAIESSEIRAFVDHCRGGVKVHDHEKQPKVPQLFINTYNSRSYNENLPKRKQVHHLNGRVVGFINLITNGKEAEDDLDV